MFLISSAAFPAATRAQGALFPVHSSGAADSGATPATQPPSPDSNVTWREVPGDFLHDQKEIWLFPTKLAKGHFLVPTMLVVGGTAALIAADPHVMPHFRQTTAFHGFNQAFSGTVSGALIAAVPSAIYLEGLLRKNSYNQTTALLAGEAVANDAVVMVVAKAITRRFRPEFIAPNGRYSDTFFQTQSAFGSSFPSGHAMMSFSVAAVVSHRYQQHRWIPYVAYGLASVISFSRVTTGAHFPSDVFMGAAIGIAIARFDVLRDR